MTIIEQLVQRSEAEDLDAATGLVIEVRHGYGSYLIGPFTKDGADLALCIERLRREEDPSDANVEYRVQLLFGPD